MKAGHSDCTRKQCTGLLFLLTQHNGVKSDLILFHFPGSHAVTLEHKVFCRTPFAAEQMLEHSLIKNRFVARIRWEIAYLILPSKIEAFKLF